MKKYKIYFSLITVISLLFILFAFKYSGNEKKTGYIILNEVFENFAMKHELTEKYKVTSEARERIIDSLAINLRLFANQITPHEKPNDSLVKKYNDMREDYLLRKQQMEEDNKKLTDELDAQIIKQMNQYIHDYGKQAGYEFIFGNDGNGALMYAIEEKNITQDVLKYINNRYAGK